MIDESREGRDGSCRAVSKMFVSLRTEELGEYIPVDVLQVERLLSRHLVSSPRCAPQSTTSIEGDLKPRQGL